MDASHKANATWLIGLLLMLAVCPTPAATNYPVWWSNVIDTNATPNDFAPATQGQLKWIATNAFVELELNLLGGAGSSVRELVSGFSASNNFCPVNLGQLKYVAEPFYDRLIEVGYTNSYPWAGATNTNDFAMANIGQVKNLFSFDIATDSDGDGMPDWWELEHGFNSTNAADATDDSDDDQYLNVYEYVHNSDPLSSNSIPTLGNFIYVSTAGTHTYPYTNWAMAATNIQRALDAATNDYTVIEVADGVYSGALNRDLQFPGNPVMLMSANGADNCIVDGEGASRVCGFCKGEDARTVLSEITIQGGAMGTGSVVCVLSSPTIQGCNAIYADTAIQDFESSPIIKHCVIRNNSAYGIWSTDGHELIQSSLIESNNSGLECFGDSSPAINDSRIGDNTYGLTCYDNSIPVIENSHIENNVFAFSSFGDSTPTIRTSWIQANYSAVQCSDASGLMIQDSWLGSNFYCVSCFGDSSATIQGCRVESNVWGVSSFNDSSLTIQACWVENSDCDAIDGFNSSTLVIEDSWIRNTNYNVISFDDSTLTIRNTWIEGGNMGVECLGNSSLTLQGCMIVNNGFGVYCVTTQSIPLIQGCVISDSSMDGLSFWSCSPVVKGCVVQNCVSNGICLHDSDAQIANCTIIENRKNGIYCEWSSAPVVTDSIIWTNAQGSFDGHGFPAEVSNSVIEGGWSGTGSTTNDPLLVPSSYRLRPDSPCIDSANGSNALEFDIDGEARWDDPAHSNVVSIVDRGADEFVDTNSNWMADVWELEYFGNLTNSADGDFDNDGLNNAAEYANGTNPTNSDTDGDSFSDGLEVAAGSDPLNPASYPVSISGAVSHLGQQTGVVRVIAVATASAWDTNHSCTLEAPGTYSITNTSNLRTYWIKAWMDTDNDGAKGSTEAFGECASNPIYIATNTSGLSVVLQDPDTDADGLPDWWEIAHFTNLNQTANGDGDGDGLSNLGEYEYGSDPNNADTDGDGINDGDEVGVGFSPATNNSYVLYADFETPSGYHVGTLDGQLEWSASSPENAQVQLGVVCRGVQAVRLQGLNVSAEKSCVFTGRSVIAKAYVYLGPQSSPPTNLPSSASCLVSFDSVQGIVAFAGDGSGGGTWVAASDTLLTGQWVQLGIEQNYSNRTWSLSVNGVEKLTELGFKNSTVTNVSTLNLQSGIGGSIDIDDIGITQQ